MLPTLKSFDAMKYIEAINKFLEKIETYLLILIVMVMVIFSFTQVVLRNLFDQGILWGDIFLRHLVLWVGFVGASLATRDRRHINIDLLTRFVKPSLRRYILFVTNIFAAVICYILAKAGWMFVMDEKAMQTILFENVEAWYFQIIIPIGFFLMMLRFLLDALQNLFGKETTSSLHMASVESTTEDSA